jgi:hypothetical protein
VALDRELVRAALTIPALLKAYGFEPSSAKENRYNDCPSCGAGCRGKFKTTAVVCKCHACGFSGDVFAVAAKILDLSSSEFPRVIAACAAAAGMAGDYDAEMIARRVEEISARQAEEAEERARRRDIAEAGAKEVWAKLSQRSAKGQEYVAGRGVMPNGAGKLCRFSRRSVCLPLWRAGKLVNVVGRRFDGGLPKIRGLDACGTMGHFGRSRRASAFSGPIVIVEGFFDYLSALQMSPTRQVLGAHGCNNLPYVAKVAAEIAGNELGIVLIPHRDDAGRAAMAEADAVAKAAGVRSVRVFDVDERGNDLSDHLGFYDSKRMP